MSLINDNFNTGTSLSESDVIYTENRMRLLEERVSKLNNLCSVLDPYQEIPENIKSALLEFHITDTSNPFEVTNKLVVLLEGSIDELQKLEKSKKVINN